MVNKVFQMYVMFQGLEEEDVIVDFFIDKMEKEGNYNFIFIRCGFFISKIYGFLGVSFDCIVYDLIEEIFGVFKFKFIQVKDGEILLGVLIK